MCSFDKDHNSFLDHTELRNLVKHLCESSSIVYCGDEAVDVLYANFDENKDGKMSFDEFHAFILVFGEKMLTLGQERNGHVGIHFSDDESEPDEEKVAVHVKEVNPEHTKGNHHEGIVGLVIDTSMAAYVVKSVKEKGEDVEIIMSEGLGTADGMRYIAAQNTWYRFIGEEQFREADPIRWALNSFSSSFLSSKICWLMLKLLGFAV